jgi:hypothetical protein
VEPGPAFFRTMQQEKKIKKKILTAEKTNILLLTGIILAT